MIEFQNSNINFTGINFSKINLSSSVSKITEKLGFDTFQKTLGVPPESLFKDGIDEKTFNRARKFLMKSVNNSSPKESLIVLNRGQITDARVCNANSGTMSAASRRLAMSSGSDVVLMHSHPRTLEDTTLPPSLTDWETLVKYPGMKAMYVISADGDYAVLRKTAQNMPDDEEINKIIGRFTLGYVDYLSKIDLPVCRQFVDLYEYGRDSVCGSFLTSKQISDLYGKLIEKIDHSGLTTDYIHNFWKTNAPKLGLEYETNFRGLN